MIKVKQKYPKLFVALIIIFHHSWRKNNEEKLDHTRNEAAGAELGGEFLGNGVIFAYDYFCYLMINT